MSEKEFWRIQFSKRGLLEGSGKYEDYEAAKKLVQSQSKLSPQVYQECLKIASDYVGYVPWGER